MSSNWKLKEDEQAKTTISGMKSISRGSTSSAGSGATDNELMPKGELSTASDLLPGRRARLKQILIVAFFIIGLIVCVTSLICILLLPSFVTNQISKVSIFSHW